MASLSDKVGVRSRPLFVVEDPTIRDDLLRLAGAACVEPVVAIDAVDGRGTWRTAPIVVVDEAAARGCLQARLTRRDKVTIVAADEAPAERTWRLASALGADHVVCLPAAEPWLIDRLGGDMALPSTPHAPVVTVIGARGGAGASVLAAGLGVTAARLGHAPILIDADVVGSGLDVLLGEENIEGIRWGEAGAAIDEGDPEALRKALPRVGELSLLSWKRGDTRAISPDSMAAAIELARRGCGLVVIDLPRHCDPSTIVAIESSDLTLLVVPSEVRAVVAAARIAAMIGPHCARLLSLIRGPAPAGLRPTDLADALALPCAGHMRCETGLALDLERGNPPAGRGKGPLAQMCNRIIAEVIDLPRPETEGVSYGG